MIEIKITANDANQRFDRFLRKLLIKSPISAIQKNIRKKNFKINGKRAKFNDFLKEGDIVELFISDENYLKLTEDKKIYELKAKLNIVYEDENLIIMDKRAGILSHAAEKKDYGNNMVDFMISYLYKTNQVNSRDKTFTPAIVNRLDRNTAGILIGAKNHESVVNLNKAIKENKISKYYLTIVDGYIKKDFEINEKIFKNENRNIVKSDEKGKEIKTKFKVIDTNKKLSLLEAELITGKTHQIRFSLMKNNTPIIGDRKYGNKKINQTLKNKTNINNQILLAYKLRFGKIKGLEYLNGKEFFTGYLNKFNEIKDICFEIFK